MKRFKLSLAAATFAAIASFAACGDSAPSNQSASTSNAAANTAAQATPATPTPTPDEFAGARADYKQFCIRCHKEDGTGGPAELDEGQKIKVPSFREGHGRGHTEAQMVKKITNGDPKEGMPAFKNRLDPERITALARFIHHEFQGQSSAHGNSNANAGASKSPTPAH